MEQAHDSVVWSIDWHPLGHILASGSNDHTVKFFTRNRLGDPMTDKCMRFLYIILIVFANRFSLSLWNTQTT